MPNRRFRLSLLGWAIVLCSHRALAAPAVGTERDVGPASSGPAVDVQTSPFQVWNGSNFVVVWNDSREFAHEEDIVAYPVNSAWSTRVTASGQVLDTVGSRIAFQGGAIAVVGGANSTLVLIERSNFHIESVVVNAQGTPVGSPVDFGTEADLNVGTLDPHITAGFDGTNFVVFHGTGGKAYGTRITPGGIALDKPSIQVSATLKGPFTSVCDGQGCAIWDLRLAPNGTVGAWPGFDGGASFPITPGMAYGNQYYLSTGSGCTWHTLLGAISYGCAVNQGLRAVAFDGTTFAGLESGAVARWLPPGGTLGAAITLGAIGTGGLSCGSGTCLTVWEDTRNRESSSQNNIDVYGIRFGSSAALDPSGGVPLALSGNAEHVPSVARGKAQYLVTWDDGREGWGGRPMAARIDDSGNVIDPNGIALPATSSTTSPASVAFDGTSYGVAWSESAVNKPARFYFARVSSAGTVLDPNPLLLGADDPLSLFNNDDRKVALGFDGKNYLAVWPGVDSPVGTNDKLFGVRISPAGQLLDSKPFAVCDVTSQKVDVSLAFNGKRFLVVWRDDRFDELAYKDDIFGAFVDPSGAVSASFAIASAPLQQMTPSVASDGNDFLVVWDDGRNDPGSTDLYGTRVSAQGVVQSPNGFVIAQGAGRERRPQVTYSERFGKYLALWSASPTKTFGDRADVLGAYVSTTDAVESPFIVSQAVDDEREAAVALDGTGAGVLFYSRFDPVAPYGTYRLRTRIIAEDGVLPDGGTEAGPDGSPSGDASPATDAGSSTGGSQPDGCNCTAAASRDGGGWVSLLVGACVASFLVRRRRPS